MSVKQDLSYKFERYETIVNYFESNKDRLNKKNIGYLRSMKGELWLLGKNGSSLLDKVNSLVGDELIMVVPSELELKKSVGEKLKC